MVFVMRRQTTLPMLRICVDLSDSMEECLDLEKIFSRLVS